MDTNTFDALSNEQKRSLLLKRGVILGRRAYNEFKTTLFALDNIYVEVLYNVETKNMACMHCSDSLELLDPYLDTIDITALTA
jgi:hypothetical protein